MSQIISDNILATTYLLLWVVTFILYHYKCRKLDGGSAIIATYIMYAVFSLLTLNDVMFNMLYEPLEY